MTLACVGGLDVKSKIGRTTAGVQARYAGGRAFTMHPHEK
jgi:hypothetical protein